MKCNHGPVLPHLHQNLKLNTADCSLQTGKGNVFRGETHFYQLHLYRSKNETCLSLQEQHLAINAQYAVGPTFRKFKKKNVRLAKTYKTTKYLASKPLLQQHYRFLKGYTYCAISFEINLPSAFKNGKITKIL